MHFLACEGRDDVQLGFEVQAFTGDWEEIHIRPGPLGFGEISFAHPHLCRLKPQLSHRLVMERVPQSYVVDVRPRWGPNLESYDEWEAAEAALWVKYMCVVTVICACVV